MLKIIGITGGIGSGKTTVCNIFETLGIAVYYADVRAKHLMTHQREVIASIKKLLGSKAYHPDGGLNRTWIGKQVFNDKQLLEKLNGIVHPATRQDFKNWVSKQVSTYTEKFVLREAAILFESGSAADTDGVINVYSPKNIRIERVINRDSVSEEDVLKRMANQWSDLIKIQKSDFTIYNDNQHMLIPQVIRAKKWVEQ